MPDDVTTWRRELEGILAVHQETGAIIFSQPESDWDQEFDPGYGGANGPSVLAWTESRVYFPVVYDGAEWIGSAPRDPRPEGQHHVGGE